MLAKIDEKDYWRRECYCYMWKKISEVYTKKKENIFSVRKNRVEVSNWKQKCRTDSDHIDKEEVKETTGKVGIELIECSTSGEK